MDNMPTTGEGIRRQLMATANILAQDAVDQQKGAEEIAARQIDAKKNFSEEVAQEGNPLVQAARFLKTSITTRASTLAKAKAGKKRKGLIPIEDIKKFLDEFSSKNNERRFKAASLALLSEQIQSRIDENNGNISPEEIINITQDLFKNNSMTHTALKFLLEYTPDARIKTRIAEAIQIYETQNEDKLNPLYTLHIDEKDIRHNPRTPLQLLELIISEYPEARLKDVVADLESKSGKDLHNANIEPAELQVIIKEIKCMQALMGPIYFFKKRMPLIEKEFAKAGVIL